ncbi:(R)-1-hydroxy-2-aminoethylphosphonate ammonia-lyase [Vibrio ezurae]|uniref:Putative class-III aminotransferase n=1 Tax=Vibrio ezurae NBRC 102218 TaxID=1219080 RepID=U3CES3_9VIBR|nr:aspartate aminotransferase family protein [Vibrio ezurae]GAD79764.1 putative class-III aminotransferase [Vibrio ezurae NBRC 102218]
MQEISREQGDINLSQRRQDYQQQALSPQAAELIQRDKNAFLHQSLSTPVMHAIAKSDGAYIYDFEGNKFLDCHGNGVHAVGFNNDYVCEKVVQALRDKNTFTSRRYTNTNIVALAEKLIEVTPDELDRVSFCPGGSEAIELAVSLAKSYTKKWKTISFWDSYHGNGFQSASLGGERLFKQGLGPMVPGALHVEFPNYQNNPWDFTDPRKVDDEILRQMEILFEKEGDIACVVGEPISATPNMPTQYFWQKVKELCEKHGALLIFDEIIEGFGRTGKMFACEHYVTPDVLVMGKSLGGGITPFAGIVTKNKFNVLETQSIGHYTHEKNGLCGAAGLATLEYIEAHQLVDNSRKLGEKLIDGFKQMQQAYPMVGMVDGIGLHIGVEILALSGSGERGVDEAERIMYRCMEHGLAFKLIEKSVITLRPSLVITDQDAQFILDTIQEAIEYVMNESK